MSELRNSLSLDEALSRLRADLWAAQQHRDPNLPLRITGIELELAVEMTDQANAEAGFNWKVVVKGAKSASETQTHRLRLTLVPEGIAADGSREPFEVAPSQAIPDHS